MRKKLEKGHLTNSGIEFNKQTKIKLNQFD